MLNKNQYNRYFSNKEDHINRKDKKFYRKRIFDLTKTLLISKEIPENIMPDVIHAFNSYVKNCITHFKELDRTDILQEDYNNITNSSNSINNNELKTNNSDTIKNNDADKLMMRSVKINKNPMDTFVIKHKKQEKEYILPKEKTINLNDPILKNKGICKKKNINNIYEDETKEKNIKT